MDEPRALERRTSCGNHKYWGFLFSRSAKTQTCVHSTLWCSIEEIFKLLQKQLLIPAMSIKVYIRGRVAVGQSSKDRWGIGSTNTPETWYRQLPTAGHTVRSDQCQILTQTRRTMPTTSTWAGWDTMCLDSVLVYFRSILNFLSRTEDKIGRVLSYISLPSFMLQVFFISSDRSLLIWQSGYGVGQHFREVPNARPRPQIMRILPMISTRDGLESNWLFSYFRAFLAEIG